MKNEAIPHLNVNGPPGAGKTTFLKKLKKLGYKVHIVSRFYTRRRRPGEKNSREHRFTEDEVFDFLKKGGFFYPGTIRKQQVNGVFYRTGVPKRKFWQKTPPGTDVIVSFLGRDGIPLKKVIPEMKMVFITCRDPQTLVTRLVKRCLKHKITPAPKIKKLQEYWEREFWKSYEFVVYNDGTPEECVKEIIQKTGLPPPKKPKKHRDSKL